MFQPQLIYLFWIISIIQALSIHRSCQIPPESKPGCRHQAGSERPNEYHNHLNPHKITSNIIKQATQ